ncbi:hypothetical protein EDD15DRAFT_2362553 [Pisolithus albus]|nr:hypothetical protein EDD15DRAFT_2362553 [Pisolithus albus]
MVVTSQDRQRQLLGCSGRVVGELIKRRTWSEMGRRVSGRWAEVSERLQIPREALGPTLQARLDFWALARGPGGTAVQVKSPPSSSEPSPPLVCPRGDLETTPEPLSSSRAPASPSRVSLSPSSTSETLDLDPEAKLALETLRVAFETLRATFKQLSRPSG